MKRLWLVLLCSLGCVPEAGEMPGGKCDETHGCRTGFLCANGVCQSPDAGAGGGRTGGGNAGAAGGTTAGGAATGGGEGGGVIAGGATAGGSTAGGSAAGGSTAGGSTAGGSTAGGNAAGGNAAGGNAAGGSVDAGCSAPCPLTRGVCAGRSYQCGDGPQSCQYGSDYEVRETLCDQKDNDCNGTTDEVRRCMYTLVGTEPFGFVDGPGSQARFGLPMGITSSASGDWYVADNYNHAIRRIDSQGNVSTVVGNGSCGYSDGPVATAQLCSPYDVAVAPNGDLYIAEERTIRVVSNGRLSVLAGSSTRGLVDGVGAAARFNTLFAIQMMPSGDLLVADSLNHRIRRVTSSGAVTTEAGTTLGTADGTRSNMQFNRPTGLVRLLNDGLIVSEYQRYVLRYVPPSGTSSVFAGSVFGNVNAPAALARFSEPRHVKLSLPDQVLYVADYSNSTIRAVPLDGGMVSSVLVTGGRGFRDGPLSTARVYWPTGLDVNGSKIALTDLNMNVRLIDLDAGVISTLAGTPPSRQQVNGPAAVASMRYVIDQTVSPDGGIYFSQQEDIPMRVFTEARGVETVLRAGADVDGPLATATTEIGITGLTFVGSDRLFYVNQNSCRLRMIDFSRGVVQTIAGGGCDRNTLQNGPFSTTRLGDIARMELVVNGGQQVLLATQCAQGVLRSINLSTGQIGTLAGTFGMTSPTGADGALAVLSSSCTDLQADGSGGAYFADGARIRHVSSAGNVTTIATPNLGTIHGLARDGNRLYFLNGTQGVSSLDLTMPAIVTREYVGSEGYRDGLSGGFFLPTTLELTPQAFLIGDYYRLRRIWR